MSVYDTYAKRKRRQEKAGQPDVYGYDEIPQSLRIQVIHIWRTAIGSYTPRFNRDEVPNSCWIYIHDTLCRELGLFKLCSGGDNEFEICCTYMLEEPDIDNVLSLIELSFRYIERICSQYDPVDKIRANVTQESDDAISELNYRFKEHGIGYQYVSGEIIRVDSQYIHAEAVRPAISLLQQVGFNGASEEFLNAHEHYRKGRNKEAIADSLKAFESTMKSICSFMKWEVPENATAKPLIEVCFSNGLIPKTMSSHFNSLRTTLESGLPTVSNRLARHGQGREKVSVPDYIAAYALHLAATNIVFLVESYMKLVFK